jgi:hypothetical protein
MNSLRGEKRCRPPYSGACSIPGSCQGSISGATQRAESSTGRQGAFSSRSGLVSAAISTSSQLNRKNSLLPKACREEKAQMPTNMG